MRILLIEDNRRLSEFITQGLKLEGMAVDCFGTVKDGLAALTTVSYDAVILDLGLPDGDGMEVLRQGRSQGVQAPVLVLTARDGIKDRVDGLNAGADDYLAKPFAMEELLARLKALMRRPGSALGATLELANIRFDTIAREVQIDGQVISMPRRELDLLEHLLRRAGRVVPKQWLEDELYAYGEEVASNSIEVAIHRLRKRLDGATASARIHTLRGVGYLIQA